MPLYFVFNQHLSRRPHFDQISIRIIEPDNLLSPTVCHKLVHVVNPRIQPFQFFHERIQVLFLKIKLCRITPQNHFFFQKTFPDLSVLKGKNRNHNHQFYQCKTFQVKFFSVRVFLRKQLLSKVNSLPERDCVKSLITTKKYYHSPGYVQNLRK